MILVSDTCIEYYRLVGQLKVLTRTECRSPCWGAASALVPLTIRTNGSNQKNQNLDFSDFDFDFSDLSQWCVWSTVPSLAKSGRSGRAPDSAGK